MENKYETSISNRESVAGIALVVAVALIALFGCRNPPEEAGDRSKNSGETEQSEEPSRVESEPPEEKRSDLSKETERLIDEIEGTVREKQRDETEE